MRKKILLCCALLILVSIIGGGTAAYFTAEGRATNVITTGTVQMELHEMQGAAGGLAEYPTTPITGIMPGQSISKIPYVENTGTGDFYTRVKITTKILAADGTTALPEDVAQFDLDKTAWTVGADGWIYYNGTVTPGEANRVAPFTTVTFSKDMGNEYQDCTVSILVEAQAVQSKNNPIADGQTILDVTGWPAA